ncbi:MAG: hypothetical protein GY937_22460 [bacterium]|nr:hypothetical protein [bacterium]
MSDKDEVKFSGTKWIVLAAVLVFVFWAAAALVTAVLGNFEASGQFGDTFGALNALFSGLAFTGVVAAVLLQSQELREQRKELRRAREEAARTARAQELYSRLSALAALIQHYTPIARSDHGASSEARERLQVLVGELEHLNARAAGLGEGPAGIVPPPDPLIITGSFNHAPPEVIAMRKRFEADGYEQKWISSHSRGEYPEPWFAPKTSIGSEIQTKEGAVWMVRPRDPKMTVIP